MRKTTLPGRRHLTPEDLTGAAIDPAELDQKRRAHLEECPSCARELEQLSARLERLGTKAREYAPRTVNRFHLPEKKSGRGGLFSRPLPLVGLAGSGALVLVLALVWGLGGMRQGPAGEQQIAALSGEALLSSVEPRLVEDEPLTPFQSFMIGQDTVVLNDEFVEFVSEPLESI